VLYIVNAALLSRPECLWTIGIQGSTISSVTPSRSEPPRLPQEIVDAAGCVVIPGLHDHHLHLFALAATARSVDCSPDALPNRADFERLLRSSSPRQGSIRGVGYFETVAGELNRTVLDAIRSDVAVRIQHRSGVAWFYNSAALRSVGLGDHPDGRLFRLDVQLDNRQPPHDAAAWAASVDDLSGVSDQLAARGVTHVTDATPFATTHELASLLDQRERGNIRQRLLVMGAPSAISSNMDCRVAAKIVLDEARSPSFDSLCVQILAARANDLPVAVHLTDRSTTWLALSALQELGARPGDRIEHGSVLDPDAIAVCNALHLMVVTNPDLARSRADDHAAQTDPLDHEHLWRCGSLIDAGVVVRAGTDAPYGNPDPWVSIRAAADRRSPLGYRIGSDRDLTPQEAIELFASARVVRQGGAACLAITDMQPGVLFDCLEPKMQAVIVDGRIVMAS
jgi:predicted amidohydrolase YtcJ